MWRRIDGQERVCATETCSHEPVWHLELAGVGSFYCSRCRSEIEKQQREYEPQMNPVDDAEFGMSP